MATTSHTPTPDPAVRPKGSPWTVSEFARHFHVTTKHVRFLMDTGKLGFIRIGKRKRLISDNEARRVEREGI